MKKSLMIFLKIFHKQALLLFLLLLAGCASSLHRGISAEIVNEIQADVVENKIETEESIEIDIISKVKPVNEIGSVKMDIPVVSINWSVPDSEKLSDLFILPEVHVQDRFVLEYKITELLYVSPFFDEYDLGWDKVYYFEPKNEVETKIETNLFEETITVKKEIPETIKTFFTERDMSASLMNKLDISLNGRGWIYLPDQENLEIEYTGRQFNAENTIYTFIPKEEGFYILRFQFQDLTDNNYTIEKINLRITKENPKDNIDNSDINPETEVMGIARTIDLESSIILMFDEGNSKGLSERVLELLESTDPSVKKILPEVAELLYNSFYYVSASSILENLIKDKTYISSSDYFLYLLGKIYEKDSIIRNEQISAGYYKTLLDSYPASLYWEESQGRYRFLKRRYIDIR